ncbi:uncharacterized protein LOC62_02G001814 [Vanrija pseudolonga]|uniref:Uncharacterized protein n=1 Tax=Vanrija pseudolonga TaxID=143232 RepID=A0AAF0Y7H3_9TREE|nr:hypothetical protein LOC62_02G001814 [Vanrija pseudolonga]
MSDNPNSPTSPGGRQIPRSRWLLSFPLQGPHSFIASEVYAQLAPHRPMATICEFHTAHGGYIVMVGVNKHLTRRDPEDVRNEIMVSIMDRASHIEFYMLYDGFVVYDASGNAQYRRAHFQAFNNYRRATFTPLIVVSAQFGVSPPADPSNVPIGAHNAQQPNIVHLTSYLAPQVTVAPQLAPQVTLAPVDEEEDDGDSETSGESTLCSWSTTSLDSIKEPALPAPTLAGHQFNNDSNVKQDKSHWPDAYRNDNDGPSNPGPAASLDHPHASSLPAGGASSSPNTSVNADEEDEDEWGGLYD